MIRVFLLCLLASLCNAALGASHVLPRYLVRVASDHGIPVTRLRAHAHWVDGSPWPWVVWRRGQALRLRDQISLMRYLSVDPDVGFGLFQLHKYDFPAAVSLDLVTNPVAQAVLVAATIKSPQAVPGGTSVSGSYAELITTEARANNLDPALVAAVIRAESSGKPYATSAAGALGLMQIMPKTARALGVSQAAELYQPEINVATGTRYLSRQLRRFGSIELALAAYNAGPDAVRKYKGIPPYAETREYVKRVKKYYRESLR